MIITQAETGTYLICACLPTYRRFVLNCSFRGKTQHTHTYTGGTSPPTFYDFDLSRRSTQQQPKQLPTLFPQRPESVASLHSAGQQQQQQQYLNDTYPLTFVPSKDTSSHISTFLMRVLRWRLNARLVGLMSRLVILWSTILIMRRVRIWSDWMLVWNAFRFLCLPFGVRLGTVVECIHDIWWHIRLSIVYGVQVLIFFRGWEGGIDEWWMKEGCPHGQKSIYD